MASKAAIIREALIVLLGEHQRDGTLPTSHRFLFYELVVRRIIAKHSDTGTRADSATDRELTRLREEGVISWDWIVDETRSLEDYTGCSCIGTGLLVRLAYTRLDPWKPRRAPLILTESRSLAGALRNLASEYRVLLAATNGQCGGFLHTDIAPRLSPRQRVLYLGDFDLAGNDIEYNTREVLEKKVGDDLAWERIALTEGQVQAYILPKIPKEDKRFLGNAGLHEAVETEALSQGVITAIVRDALDRLLPVPLDQVLAREKEERQALEAKLRAIDPSLFAEEEEQVEEPELPEVLLAIAGEMDDTHWVRQARGKLRRALVKAGRKPSEGEISALLSRCIELEVPLTERSISRIARAIKGKITLESLR
jgi:hypothetical protein